MVGLIKFSVFLAILMVGTAAGIILEQEFGCPKYIHMTISFLIGFTGAAFSNKFVNWIIGE